MVVHDTEREGGVGGLIERADRFRQGVGLGQEVDLGEQIGSVGGCRRSEGRGPSECHVSSHWHLSYVTGGVERI